MEKMWNVNNYRITRVVIENYKRPVMKFMPGVKEVESPIWSQGAGSIGIGHYFSGMRLVG